VSHVLYTALIIENFPERVKINSLHLSMSRQCETVHTHVRFQVLTAAGMMFRIVFWDILPLKRRSTIILHGSISQKTILNINGIYSVG
jgi:hypothetical protein